MPDQWFIRVEGKEYGPADLGTLHDWQEEGRVLPSNEARSADSTVWIAAAEIPGLFNAAATSATAPVESPPLFSTPLPQRSTGRILAETIRIYIKGFPQFFCLSLLILIPSLCSQLTRMFLASFATIDPGIRGILEFGVSFCMLILFLVFWPIYISAIQIVTAEIASDRRLSFFEALNEAVKFWPRVAVLCVFVYGSYFCLTVILITVVLTIGLGSPSVVSFFLVLVLLAAWVWIIGRLWVNFLFWQQFAVLERLDVPSSLQESKRLARSGGDLSWSKRPLWRGAFLFSLWCLIALAFDLPSSWPILQNYLHQMSTATDPQTLLESLKTGASDTGVSLMHLALWSLQQLLKPLLGIAFVLLYFDASAHRGDEE